MYFRFMWLKFCDYTKIAPPWLILFGNSQDANPFGYVSSLVYLYRTLITSSSLTQIPLSHSHLNLFVIPYEATVLCRRVYTRKLITEGLWLSLPSLKTKGPVSCDSLWGKGTSFLPHPGYFFLPASSTLLHLCAFTQTFVPWDLSMLSEFTLILLKKEWSLHTFPTFVINHIDYNIYLEFLLHQLCELIRILFLWFLHLFLSSALFHIQFRPYFHYFNHWLVIKV